MRLKRLDIRDIYIGKYFNKLTKLHIYFDVSFIQIHLMIFFSKTKQLSAILKRKIFEKEGRELFYQSSCMARLYASDAI